MNYAVTNTKGNRSEAIVELIEMGLAVTFEQQSQSFSLTVQDSKMPHDLRETVAALTEQINQLTAIMLDSVMHRLTVLETELGELSA